MPPRKVAQAPRAFEAGRASRDVLENRIEKALAATTLSESVAVLR